MSGLRSWVANQLLSLVGYSQATLVQDVISISEKSSTPAEIMKLLVNMGLPSSMETQAFAQELFSLVEHKTSGPNHYLQKECEAATLAKKQRTYTLSEADDDEADVGGAPENKSVSTSASSREDGHKKKFRKRTETQEDEDDEDVRTEKERHVRMRTSEESDSSESEEERLRDQRNREELEQHIRERDAAGTRKKLKLSDDDVPSAARGESTAPSSSYPTRLPTFHASALGPWHAVIAYDACVRLCLHAWAKGCMEAPMFLENECALFRDVFNVRQVLLQSEEELMSKHSSEIAVDGATAKPKKMVRRMKVQVRRVKLELDDSPAGCISTIKVPKVNIERVRHRMSSVRPTLSFGWKAFGEVLFTPACISTIKVPKVNIERVRHGISSIRPTVSSGWKAFREVPFTPGCISTIKVPKVNIDRVRHCMSSIRPTVSSGWKAFREVPFTPGVPPNGSFSRLSLAYLHAGTNYIKQVSGLLKVGVKTLCSSSSSYDSVQETYSCLLRLKSSTEEDAIRMHPGSGESHVFFPDGLGDDLVIEVQDSNGKQCGCVLAQIATIAEDQGEKLRWWSMYHDPDHNLVGRVQLYIHYSANVDENNLKCGPVAETVAYDIVLEVAMKIQCFQQRNLLLHGPWKWLLSEFASYYGVSDAYTKLRYLAYVMDVATPTADCLTLVYDLLFPVLMKGHGRKTLSHQENRILGEIEDQLEEIFARVFENYKSLDESSPSGMMEFFRPATGVAAPVLEPAVQLYSLLHDMLSFEAQNKLYCYFQAAARKRSRRHLSETDEYVSRTTKGFSMDAANASTAYQKMKSSCLNLRNEVFTDIEIQNQHILPIFVDLPNLSAAIYSAQLCSRLRAFLIACPPPGPSPPVAELVIATADFQRDLTAWNITLFKGGVDAKELFHVYIVRWIQVKRLVLLESCKLDKVKWSGVRTQHSITPFIDDMYDRLKETLNDYDVIISRWPEYTFVLENSVADVEKAIVNALEKQYADVLAPLKENLVPKNFGLECVQKLARRSVSPYVAPDELGVLLNSMKRILDVLHPEIEQQLRSWGSCIPDGGNSTPGERLNEVAVMLRSKFRNYLQSVVEKLAENTKLQRSTKLKKILKDSKDAAVESDIRRRMQPLKDQLVNSINHLHSIFETHVFVACCRGYWCKLGQDVLSFLESGKENRSWYKGSRVGTSDGLSFSESRKQNRPRYMGSRVATSVLDDTFASQMQQLLGNILQEKDLEPPWSILKVRSIVCIPKFEGSE